MKKGIIFLLGLAAIVILGLLIAAQFFTGDTISAERSINVNAPPLSTYMQVADVRNWKKWSPWLEMDPELDMKFSEMPVGKGAYYTWTSDHENLGDGKLTITDVHRNKTVETFVQMGDSEGNGVWDFTQNGKGSIVTWKFSYEPKNFTERIMGLFFNRMMGPSLENGLERLKDIAEKTPPPGFDVRSNLQERMQEVRDSLNMTRKK